MGSGVAARSSEAAQSKRRRISFDGNLFTAGVDALRVIKFHTVLWRRRISSLARPALSGTTPVFAVLLLDYLILLRFLRVVFLPELLGGLDVVRRAGRVRLVGKPLQLRQVSKKRNVAVFPWKS